MHEMLLQALANGLVTGSVFGLIAVGLTLTFGVMQIVNFAHGDFLMVAMYATFLLFTYAFISPYAAIMLAVPLLFVLGALMYRLLIEPLLDAPHSSQILMTLGAFILMQNVALLIFKGDPFSIIVPWANESVRIGPVSLGLARILAAGCCLAVTIGIFSLLNSTDLGRMLRATAQDRNVAQLMGVNVRRMYMLSLALGVGCLGIAGPVLIPWSYVSPDVGLQFTLTAFIIVVLGGMGSVKGAFIGGLIIGVVSALGQVLLPGTYGLIPQYLVFILALLFRPQGLFGGRI